MNEQWLADVVRKIYESGAAPCNVTALAACMTALSATAEMSLPMPEVVIDGDAPWADVEAHFDFPGGARATIAAHGEDWHPRHEDPDKRMPTKSEIALYAHGLSPWHLVDFVRAAAAMPQRPRAPSPDKCSESVHVWAGSVHVYGPGQFSGDERCLCGALRACEFGSEPTPGDT